MVDDFEDGLYNWTAQNPWGTTSSESYSGSYSVTDSPGGDYSNNVNSTLTLTESIDLTDAIYSHVEFATKYNIEQGYDFAYFEVSTDGYTWNTLTSFTGIQSSWTAESIDLIDYCGEIVYFRFRFSSDLYVTEDGIYIDDFKLYKYEHQISTEENPKPILRVQLYQNYPNPFSTSTTISFSTTDLHGFSQIKIYNVKGQLIRSFLYNHPFIQSSNSFVWDGKDENGKPVSSGIYFCKLLIDGKAKASNKMLLLR
jgi:hypothetical protein